TSRRRPSLLRCETLGLGEMHGADRSFATRSLNATIKDLVGELRRLRCCASAVEFFLRANENPNFVGNDPSFVRSISHLPTACILLQRSSQNDAFRRWPVERRDRTLTFLLVSVDIGDLGTQEAVGFRS